MTAEFNWDAINEIIGSREIPPPDGAITIQQFAYRKKMSRSSAESTLKKLVEHGHLLSGRFWETGTHRWSTYYWTPPKGKRK